MALQSRPQANDRTAARRALVQLLAERLVRDALAQASRPGARPLTDGQPRRNARGNAPDTARTD